MEMLVGCKQELANLWLDVLTCQQGEPRWAHGVAHGHHCCCQCCQDTCPSQLEIRPMLASIVRCISTSQHYVVDTKGGHIVTRLSLW